MTQVVNLVDILSHWDGAKVMWDALHDIPSPNRRTFWSADYDPYGLFIPDEVLWPIFAERVPKIIKGLGTYRVGFLGYVEVLQNKLDIIEQLKQTNPEYNALDQQLGLEFKAASLKRLEAYKQRYPELFALTATAQETKTWRREAFLQVGEYFGFKKLARSLKLPLKNGCVMELKLDSRGMNDSLSGSGALHLHLRHPKDKQHELEFNMNYYGEVISGGYNLSGSRTFDEVIFYSIVHTQRAKVYATTFENLPVGEAVA